MHMDMSSSKEAMKEKVKLKEYNGYTLNIKYWMLFTGTWPIARPGILYRVIPFVAIASTITLSIMLLRFAIANISNVSIMVKGFSLGTSFISIAFKVFLFTLYKDASVELYTILQKYHEESLADETQRYIVLQRVTGFRRLTWILKILVYQGCLMYFLIPIISIIIQTHQHVQSIKYILPVTALYPWEIYPGGLLYKITYIFETYNILCLGIVTCGVDSLFGYYIFHIIGQLRILSYQMRSLQLRGNDHELICKWVSKFQVLRKCCGILQKIYGPVILWQVITNSAVICTVLFQISQAAKISVGRYILIIGYSGTKVMQTFIYAWAGTALTAESEVLRESVYFSDWVGAERHRFRTSILIILTQKPLKITSAGCVIVSIDMFLMTLNTAVSYFCLLLRLEGKQM